MSSACCTLHLLSFIFRCFLLLIRITLTKQGHPFLFLYLGLLLGLLFLFFLHGNFLLDLIKFLYLLLVQLNGGLVCEVSLSDFLHLLLEVVGEAALEELGANVALGLFHDVLVAELCLDVLDALDIGVGDLAVLGAIALLNLFGPLDAVEL